MKQAGCILTTWRSVGTSRAIAALVCLSLGSVPAVAQIAELRLPISLDADATDYDGKNSMLMFRGLRLSQGPIGVEAELGMASKLDFEDSVWQFSGNVRIETSNGSIRCDQADLRFGKHQLQTATISGSPATFELRRRGSDEITYAEAGRLQYNFADGIVEFSENAVISEGGNQISSNYLVYNIAEQRINAEASGENGEKVKIIYTPAVDDEDTSIPAQPGPRDENTPDLPDPQSGSSGNGQ